MRLIGQSHQLAKPGCVPGRARFLSTAAVALCFAFSAQVQTQETNNTDVGWDFLGGGHSSQYSPLDQINRSNVKDHEVAWTFEAGEDPSGAFGFRFSPTIIGDKVFVMADGTALVALIATTGTKIKRVSVD